MPAASTTPDGLEARLGGLALDQLLAFDRVAREGSFSRAALALGIGQPAVSSRIQALEAALGGAVFQRGRRITLTALGESFLPYVRRAFEVLGEGAASARQTQAGQRGRVSLGVLGSLAAALVAPVMQRFLRTHPGVDCLIRASDHERMLGLLLDGMVELAQVVWPCAPALEPELRALHTLDEPVVLVAHPRHPLARARRPDRDVVVALARPLYRLRWWQEHDPNITALTARTGRAVDLPMEVAHQLIARGDGAGFFPRAYVAGDLARRSLRAIEVRGLPPITRKTALVRRLRAGPMTPVTAAFAAALRQQAGRLGRVTGPGGRSVPG